MSLGGGASKSQSTSDSESSAYGYTGSQSQDTSRSLQQSTSGGSTTQSLAFQDLFAQLYGGASTAAKGATASAGDLMQHASQLFSGGREFLENLKTNSGLTYMQERLQGGKDLLNEQIGNLKSDIGSFFKEQLMPGVKSGAVSGGNLGGGRQGVAEGLAAREAGEQFTKGATALRVADQQQRDAIAGQIANNSVQAASTGLGALPSLLDLSERGANAELGIYSNLAQILGGPTVLSQSENFAQSTGQSVSDAFARSFGENTASSKSKGQSTSSSFNFSAGMG